MSVFLLSAAAVAAGLAGSGCAYNAVTARQMERDSDSKSRNRDTGILAGAEPVFLKGSSRTAVLLIHGFIGSPSDFADFPEKLHRKGYTVSVPLLPGHGTRPSDFSKTTAEELESCVLRHYRDLKGQYDEVYVVGLSLGGSLAVLLAAREKVDKLVLAAPYLKIAHQWYYLLPAEFYQAVFSDLIPYVYRPAMFKQVNKRESADHIVDYAYVPLKGAGTAIRLGRRALEVSGSIGCPTLILHAKADRATDYRESVRLARRLEKHSKARLVTLSKSNHMIFWDYDAPAVEQEILSFLAG